MNAYEIARLAIPLVLMGALVFSLWHFGFGGGDFGDDFGVIVTYPENTPENVIREDAKRMKETMLDAVRITVAIVCVAAFGPMAYRRWRGESK